MCLTIMWLSFSVNCRRIRLLRHSIHSELKWRKAERIIFLLCSSHITRQWPCRMYAATLAHVRDLLNQECSYITCSEPPIHKFPADDHNVCSWVNIKWNLPTLRWIYDPAQLTTTTRFCCLSRNSADQAESPRQGAHLCAKRLWTAVHPSHCGLLFLLIGLFI